MGGGGKLEVFQNYLCMTPLKLSDIQAKCRFVTLVRSVN
jgi:hypothetical protein